MGSLGRSRRVGLAIVSTTSLLISSLPAQTPTPSASPSPTASASLAPSPSVDTQNPTGLINTLTAADLQAAFGALKANFAEPGVITEVEMNRATLQGLMARLGHGLLLLPDKATTPIPIQNVPFYAEVLEDHVAYLRPGSLSNATLQTTDKKLVEFASKKTDGLIVDLRGSTTDDFNIAAEFAKRFCPRGKTLFSLQKAGKAQKTFVSDRDPTVHGMMMVLIDGDTVGGAEALAGAIRSLNKVLTIGEPTAGGAVEYTDSSLPSGKVLRVATAEITVGENQSLYPGGVKPDLPVELATADKRQIFQASLDKGMGPFIHEAERPHFNEAALLAGTNPELESAEQRRARSNSDRSPKDAVLQRALDVIASLEVYEKR